MNDLDIAFNKDRTAVSIIDHNGRTLFQLPCAQLPLIVDNNLSKWIIHLLEKRWVDEHILYRLAMIINEMYPGSSIDWSQTFATVEMCFRQKSLMNSFASTNIVERFYQLFEATRDSSHEINAPITEGLNTRLRQLNLI
jgi:hypothetical protein